MRVDLRFLVLFVIFCLGTTTFAEGTQKLPYFKNGVYAALSCNSKRLQGQVLILRPTTGKLVTMSELMKAGSTTKAKANVSFIRNGDNKEARIPKAGKPNGAVDPNADKRFTAKNKSFTVVVPNDVFRADGVVEAQVVLGNKAEATRCVVLEHLLERLEARR